jgi:hypothetical protein
MVNAQDVTSGFALGLAGLLIVAAVAKGRDQADFEHTLVGLLPGRLWRFGVDSRRLARCWIAVEAVVAVALVGVPVPLGAAAAGAATAVTATFVPAAAVANRRGVPCNCLGRQSRRPGRRAVGGAVLLCAVAVATLVSVLAGSRLGAAHQLSWTAAVLALTVAGGWGLLVLPGRGRTGRKPARAAHDRAAELRRVDDEAPEYRAYRRLVMAVAERRGGVDVVRCLRGSWFGEPRRTPPDCARRLGLPVSTVQTTYDRVLARADAAWRARPESGQLQERKRVLREAAAQRPRNTPTGRQTMGPATEGSGR